MSVDTIAREEVVTVGPEESVAVAATTMRERQVGSLIVVEDEAPVGILTDRDLVIEVLGTDANPDQLLVREVMTADPLTVSADESVQSLFETMANAGIRRLPVVADGKLAGIVTLDDLVVLLSMQLQGLANVIRTESPPYETDGESLF